MASLSEIDRDIIRLKKRLQTNKMKQQDPNWQKRRNELQKLRRVKKMITDPEHQKLVNAKQRERYAKNPGPQIESSKKWNLDNKERKNANQRALYAKNPEKMRIKIRERRRKKRELKNG